MKRKSRIWIWGPALLMLIAVLGVLVAGRIRTARTVTTPLQEEVQAETAASAGLNPEVEAGAASPAPETTPSPTPTPTPTPRPLRELAICEDNLDRSLFEPAKEQGTVELVQYMTEDRVSGGGIQVMKDLAVYLPYGYDPSKQYDVLMLLHCAGFDHRFWLVDNREYRILGEGLAPSQDDWTLPGANVPGGVLPVYVPNMLDRMIEDGWCRPLIVVSPCIYLYDGQPSAAGNAYDYVQFSREIGPDLMAYIHQQNY